MNETSKNYEERIKNGDFEKYLHGLGIDIGGGNDCLILPQSVKGKVKLWDLKDGDAQYLHKIRDEKYDFVYSSHCLEDMRNVYTAFINWIRVCKTGGGYLYICVPHEIYYEKGIWPSVNNPDHKYSFTVDKKSALPKNIVVNDFLKYFSDYIEVLEVRENLMNYDFNCDKSIDQTADESKCVCAQIDIIVRKKKGITKTELKKYNKCYWTDQIEFYCRYWMDQIEFYCRRRICKMLPYPIKSLIKKAVTRWRRKQCY